MATEIDIANLALSHLGDDATIASIDPPEGSAQAEHCARFYPIARDALLELHDWKFATRRDYLPLLEADSWDWTYAYAEPANALRIIAVLPATGSAHDQTEEFETESTGTGAAVILTNLEDATARYTVRVTDTTRFSPLFVDALAWLLASYLAGPVLKGDAGAAMAKSCLASFAGVMSRATVSDANQRQTRTDHMPAHIAGR